MIKTLLFISLLMVSHATLAVKSLPQKLDEYFSQLYQADMPGASVLIAKGDKIILHKAYGLADVEHQIPLTTDMHFRIASLTKQITSSAILKLHQDGLINVNDPVTKYLPDYNTHGHTITLEHLATNRSGIPDYTLVEGFIRGRDIMPTNIDKLIAEFSAKPLDFPPNEREAYSSSNFIVLAKVIETITGKSYEDYLKAAFFDELGMKDTAYGRLEKIMPGRVSGYEVKDGELINAPYISMTAPHAAGALRSTTMDMYRWQRGLLGGKVFEPKKLQRAWSQQILNDGYDSTYGYGWFIGELSGHRTLSHAGGISGFVSYSALLPAEDIHVIILSNFINPNMSELFHYTAQVIKMVLGEPISPAQRSAHKSLLTTMPGEYDYGGGMTSIISRKGDDLFMTLPWSDKAYPLYYADENRVYFDGTWSTLKLLPKENFRGDMVLERWNGERIFLKRK